MQTTMNVARIHAYGDANVFQLEKVSIPTPASDEILIENVAVGINYGELMQRQGTYPIPVPLPAVLGSEVAGRVVQVGSQASSVQVGDRVAALLLEDNGSWQSNGYAEYALAKARHAVRIPDNLTEAQSLGLLAQGLTAYLMLTQTLSSVEGKSVAISGASGGVGSMAIQIARLLKANGIIALTRTDDNSLLIALGATHVVNNQQPDWDEILLAHTSQRGVDVFLDAVGGTESKKSLRALAPFGHLIVYGALSGHPLEVSQADMWTMVFKNQTISGFANMAYLGNADMLQAALAQLFEWGAAGLLNALTTAFPLADVSQAHRAMEERQTIGKVVLVTK